MNKIIAGAKVDALAVPIKTFIVFSRTSVTAICCVLGALLRDNKLMGTFCLHIVRYIIDFLTRAHSKLATGLLCLCFSSEKLVSVISFLRYLLSCFFAN